MAKHSRILSAFILFSVAIILLVFVSHRYHSTRVLVVLNGKELVVNVDNTLVEVKLHDSNPRINNFAEKISHLVKIQARYQNALLHKKNIFDNKLHKVVDEEQQIQDFLLKIKNNATLKSIADKEYKDLGFDCKPKPPAFPCIPFRLNSSATSVHELTAADISVIGALGDSLTAANGANADTVLGVLINYRGYAFTAGGQGTTESNPTLPNLLKKYNTKLTGYSTGSGGPNSKNAGLNVAVQGAKSISIDEQARRLIQRMKSDTKVNYEKDWKLINIFIGQNDICGYCKKPDILRPEDFQSRLKTTLDLLHEAMPRTLVNLITPLDVFLVRQLNIGLICSGLHQIMCKCAAYPKNETAVIALTNEYQRTLRDLVDSGRYDTKDDFTVVVQPFFEKTTLPTNPSKPSQVDLTYFAPDCFHLSLKGHWQAGLALWNGLWQPVSNKRHYWSPGEPYTCPSTKRPYISTSKNS